MRSAIVLVPIYKPHLDALERYSLDVSFAALKGRQIRFIGPQGLDFGYYVERYPEIPLVAYDSACFASVQGYSRLLLNVDFYRQFADDEFMLILQTDAIVLRDELDHWCALPFDYVGAPWPDGVELFVNIDRFSGDKGRRIRAMVGNGGLSLRRISKCISLLQEFPEACNHFLFTGSSEDLFFSFMGLLSMDFVLPNEITASAFSLELKPEYYYSLHRDRVPMGGHAWWKYNPDFWFELLGPEAKLLCS